MKRGSWFAIYTCWKVCIQLPITVTPLAGMANGLCPNIWTLPGLHARGRYKRKFVYPEMHQSKLKLYHCDILHRKKYPRGNLQLFFTLCVRCFHMVKANLSFPFLSSNYPLFWLQTVRYVRNLTASWQFLHTAHSFSYHPGDTQFEFHELWECIVAPTRLSWFYFPTTYIEVTWNIKVI